MAHKHRFTDWQETEVNTFFDSKLVLARMCKSCLETETKEILNV